MRASKLFLVIKDTNFYGCLLQGIIERDISVIRKETEIASLNSDLSSVRAELAAARKTIFSLQVSISHFLNLNKIKKEKGVNW
jgi:hypothetical protein